MAFFRRSEKRTQPLTYAQLLNILGEAVGDVDPLRALTRSGIVFRCAQVSAGAIASMPLKEYRDKGDGDRQEIGASSILANPHRELTPYEWKELVALHLMTWGNAFLVIERNQGGAPIFLDPIAPSAVNVRRTQVTDANPAGREYLVTLNAGAPNATTKTLTPDDLLHIPGLGWDGIIGLSPVGVHRKGIGASIAAERYAMKLWEKGNLQSGILKSDSLVSPDQAARLKQRWQEKTAGIDNAQEIAVLDGGVNFQQTSINPKDAQFIEAREYQRSEIAAMYGLNPALVPEDTEKWLKFSLLPYLHRIEQRLSQKLLPRGRFCEFVTDGLLRADIRLRFAAYAVGLQNGFLSLNQVEAWENWPLTPGGDTKKPLQPGTGTPNAHVIPNDQGD